MDLYTACYKSKSRASKFKQMCDPTGNVKTRFLCQKYNNFAPLTCLPYLLSNEKTYRYINIHHIAVDIDGLAVPRPCRHWSDPLRHPTCRDNRQYIGLRQDHHRRNNTGIDVCHIVGRMHIALPPQNTAPDNRPDTATHTTVTSPADDTPPDADTADTVSNGSGLTTIPSEQTVPTELLHKIIDFGLAHSDSHQKISDNLRALTKESRHTDAHARESFRLLNSQTEIFQQLFDTAFLCTYPRFVDRLNSLLLPEKTFPHPTPGQLTPELRVAAFMRIGVDDCNRIARTLGLSLNTVYTYRNRTRQRAADRNRFMAELMKIS